jgi:SprT-like family
MRKGRNTHVSVFTVFPPNSHPGHTPVPISQSHNDNQPRRYAVRQPFTLSQPEQITDEIAFNPSHFANLTPTQTLSTLVHEMVHLWQHHFGKPSRAGYHNRDWAVKMRAIGLIPTSTGEPGGKETGQQVTHYIEPGGRFERACAAFLASGASVVLYHDRAGEGREPARKKKAASKTKYTCPDCGVNAWAKPGVSLICGECQEPMEAETDEEAAGALAEAIGA